MDEDEKVLSAGPSMEHQEVVVQALREQAIPARIVAIKDLEPMDKSALPSDTREY